VDPLGVLGLVGLVSLWWGATYFQFVPRLFLPSPDQVAETIATNFVSSPYLSQFRLGANGGLAGSLMYTTTNVILGILIACLLGVALGLTSGRIGVVRAVFDPIVLTAGTIPIVVTAPFFLIWFGTDRAAQVILLLLYDTTILYLFAQRAAGNLNPIHEAAARTLGATTIRILVDVYLKGTLPEVFGGIRIALAGAWGLEAIAELLGAPNGIGNVIEAVARNTDTLTTVSAILSLAIVAVGLDFLLAAIFRFVTRWRAPVRVHLT
jgi:ABC-type nitrate/sulfonate/bicarbonate transport system permease component